MPVQIKWRRDTSANWTSVNPVLAQGEPGFEINTTKFKIGNGTSAWNSLPYADSLYGNTGLIAGIFKNVGSSDPSSPAAGKLKIYMKTIAGRMMLKQVGPSGQTTAIQPHFARNKIGYWNPQGNSNVVPAPFGFTPYTTIGTATAATVATTNTFTRMRRLSFVSSNGKGSVASFRVAVAQVQLGDGFGSGGFYKLIRFGSSDTVGNARQFIGVSANTGAPTNVEPSTLVNSIGVGHGASDSNLMIYYGGSIAQTPINLGANFPINTSSVDAYELALFSPAEEFATVFYEVTRINTGDVVTGAIIGDSISAELPSPDTQLSYSWNYRTNNATASPVTITVMSDYIETDN